MFFAIITLLVALSISAIAAWYSIVGLTAIFAAAVFPIILMGAVLEVGKITATVWLHQHWQRAPAFTRWYLSMAVIILMFITSMGIFGFLSKSHIEQTALGQDQQAVIQTIEANLSRSTGKIDRWMSEIDKLNTGDSTRVDNLVDKEQDVLTQLYTKIDKEKDSVRADSDKKIELQNNRLKQAQERKEADIKAAKDRFEGSIGGGAKYDKAVEKARNLELSVASRVQKEIIKIQEQLTLDLKAIDDRYADDIEAIQNRIQNLRNQANVKTEDVDGRINELEVFISKEQVKVDGWRGEKFNYEKEYRKLEAEVGPIKYIAEFVYGQEADRDLLEAAVRWVIIIIVIVFDPLAIMLVLAGTMQIKWAREEKAYANRPEAKQRKIEELQMKIDDYTKFLQQLEEKMDALQSSNEAKDKDITKLQKQIDKAEKEKDNLEARLMKLMGEKEESYTKTLDSMKSKVDKKDAMVSELKEMVKSLEEKEPEVVEKLVEVEKVVEDETKIKKAQEELAKLESQKNLTEAEKQKLAKLQAQTQKEKEEMQIEIKARDAAIARLNEKYKLVEASTTPSILQPQADDDDGSVPPATYGSKFPADAVNGQLFTKTDVFPHKLFKWNTKKWIEVDKEGTDSYLTEDYVRKLVEQVASGEIELEDLSEPEKGQMTDFLSNGRE